MTIDIEPLRKHLGRKIEDEDIVTEAPLKAMIATFDRDEKAPAPGQPIAPGWHLCFLHSYARRASLGRDGAAFEGGVLPKIPMPRRMYAGSTFTFDGDMTPAAFAKLALALDGATQSAHGGHPDFRAGGKVFATEAESCKQGRAVTCIANCSSSSRLVP